MAFNTNDTERARITSGGNVGIGTTSPSEKLHILGSNAALQVEESGGALIKLRAGGTGYFGTYNNTNLAFVTNSTERMRITSGGNLLIGNTSGTSTLEIEKTTTTGSGFKLRRNLSSGSMDSPLVNIVEDSQYADETTLRIQNDGSGDIINVFDGTTEVFTILDGGNVEIQGSLQVGVDDTGYDVTFYGDTSGQFLQWDASENRLEFKDSVRADFGTGSDMRIYHDGSDSYIEQAGNGSLVIYNSNNGADIRLRCDDGSGGVATYLTLDGSQTTINLQQIVLIGTTVNSGVYKLDVAGKQRVQSVLELDDVLTLNAISTPSDPAANKSSIYMDSSDGAIKVKINVGGTVVTRTIASFE